MSTLNILHGTIAPSISAAPASPGLFARLSQARELRARRQILAYLASQTDARLAGFGFSPEDIHELRQASPPIPVARLRSQLATA